MKWFSIRGSWLTIVPEIVFRFSVQFITSSSLSSWRNWSPLSRSSKVSRHKSAEVGILISWDFTFYWETDDQVPTTEKNKFFFLKIKNNIAYHKITIKLMAALQHPTAFDIILSPAALLTRYENPSVESIPGLRRIRRRSVSHEVYCLSLGCTVFQIL